MSSGAGKRLEKRRGIGAKKSRDPFAVDFFDSESRVRKNDKKPSSEKLTLESWHEGLKVVSAETVRKPLTFGQKPVWLETFVAEAIRRKIRKFSKIDSSAVAFKAIGFERVDYSSEKKALLSRGNSVFGVSSGMESGAIAIGRVFLSDLIDSFLKGSVSEARLSENLTAVEQTIAYYLLAEIVSSFNELVPDGVNFVIDGFSEDGDSNDESVGEVIEIVGELIIGGVSGMITFLVTEKGLNQVSAGIDQTKERLHNNEKVAKRLGTYVSGLEAHVRIGFAALSVSEMRELERGDVVICSSDIEDVWGSEFDNLATVMRIGDSEFGVALNRNSQKCTVQIRRTGEVFESESERVNILSSAGENMSNEDFEGIGLDSLVEGDNPQAESESDAGVDLDSVMVDLHVRFAGRRISLSELGALQNGQVLDIGCKPDDPVELVAENSGRPVASGQLVKVDGQLGVRVTRVFV